MKTIFTISIIKEWQLNLFHYVFMDNLLNNKIKLDSDSIQFFNNKDF